MKGKIGHSIIFRNKSRFYQKNSSSAPGLALADEPFETGDGTWVFVRNFLAVGGWDVDSFDELDEDEDELSELSEDDEDELSELSDDNVELRLFCLALDRLLLPVSFSFGRSGFSWFVVGVSVLLLAATSSACAKMSKIISNTSDVPIMKICLVFTFIGKLCILQFTLWAHPFTLG